MGGRNTRFLTLQWMRAHHFIFFMSMAAGCSFVAGYTISILDQFVEPVWPAISSTGMIVLETFFIGQMVKLILDIPLLLEIFGVMSSTFSYTKLYTLFSTSNLRQALASKAAEILS